MGSRCTSRAGACSATSAGFREVLPHDLTEHRGVHRPYFAALLLPGLDEDVRRDRVDPVRPRDESCLVNVHFRELDAARELHAQVPEHRVGDAARGAPVGIEVDDDGERRPDDLALERRVGDPDWFRPPAHDGRSKSRSALSPSFVRHRRSVRSSSTATEPPSPELATALLRWYRLKRRPLPWRVDRDPYRVWVAEVLLQQTRVAQAIPYYARFVATFPTLEALARAPLGRVLKVWEGAGYYARAHRLHEAARILVRKHGGRLPSTVPELETLPGVGPYIARAVAAIAFGRREVALEANGLRVAARWTRESGDLRSASVRDRLGTTLAALLPRTRAGDFNEAVMELGETVCTPVHPRCASCPAAFACRAYRELADPGSLPVRAGR